MAMAELEASTLQYGTEDEDEWPENDVDDGIPFLLPETKTVRRGSSKAQQLLGLVAVTSFRSGPRCGQYQMRGPRTATPARSEPQSTRSSLDMEDEEDDDAISDMSSETVVRRKRRHSLKAQQMLGLVPTTRQMPNWGTGYRTSFLLAGATLENQLARSEGSVISRVGTKDALLWGQYPADAESVGDTDDEPLLLEERPLSIDSLEGIEQLLDSYASSPSSPFIGFDDWSQPFPQTPSPQTTRVNGYINFSRPLSQQSPQATPRVSRETEPSPLRMKVAREDLGLPRTPSRTGSLAIARPIFERVPANRRTSDIDDIGSPTQRRSRLWASIPIPMCLVRVGKRRYPEDEMNQIATSKEDGKEENPLLTEGNLRKYEVEVGSLPMPLLPTPVHSPFHISLIGDPSMENVGEGTLLTTPSSSATKYPESMSITPYKTVEGGSSAASPSCSELSESLPTTPTKEPMSTPLRTPSVTPTLHVATAKAVNQRTIVDLTKCIICREEKLPTAFPIRQCTFQCTHVPHTCLSCIQQWVASCCEACGWEACVCPECHASLTWSDVKFFAPDNFILPPSP